MFNVQTLSCSILDNITKRFHFSTLSSHLITWCWCVCFCIIFYFLFVCCYASSYNILTNEWVCVCVRIRTKWKFRSTPMKFNFFSSFLYFNWRKYLDYNVSQFIKMRNLMNIACDVQMNFPMNWTHGSMEEKNAKETNFCMFLLCSLIWRFIVIESWFLFMIHLLTHKIEIESDDDKKKIYNYFLCRGKEN